MGKEAAGAAVVVIVLVAGAGFVGLSFLIGAGTTATTTINDDDGFAPVLEFVLSTFDGQGFADRPGMNSTLDSTFTALQLLDLLNLSSDPALQDDFDASADAIKATQGEYGWFGVSPDNTERLRATAMSLAALNLMGRLDDETRFQAAKFVANVFRGGLTWEDWLTNGIYIYKHWGAWANREICTINHTYAHPGSIFDVGPITIAENVFNLGEPPETPVVSGVILYWGECYWNDEFTSKSFGQRLIYVQGFEWLIVHRHERPILLHLIADINGTIDELAAEYIESTGSLSLDMTYSASLFHLLTSMGGLEKVYTPTTRDSRLAVLSQAVKKVVSISDGRCNPNRTVSEVKALTETWLDVQYGLANTTMAVIDIQSDALDFECSLHPGTCPPLSSRGQTIPSHLMVLARYVTEPLSQLSGRGRGR